MSTTPDNHLSRDVRALLDHERDLPQVPAITRARVLARARAALIAAGPASHVVRQRPAPVRWAVAAAVTFAAAAAVGAGAYEVRSRLDERAMLSATPVAAAPAAATARIASAPAIAEGEAAPSHLATRAPRGDAAREELRLLRLTREAVARQDFAAALPLIAEHGRRFQDGRLAEEREALRVRALAGLGRTDEARRAAVRFEARFPRSVLLPAVRQMPATRP